MVIPIARTQERRHEGVHTLFHTHQFYLIKEVKPLFSSFQVDTNVPDTFQVPNNDLNYNLGYLIYLKFKR